MTGFAAILDHLRGVVAKLPPITRGESPAFVLATAPLDDEAAALDRHFEIRAEGVGTTQDAISERRQILKTFAVRIRYDARHHAPALEQRLAEDEEQIIDTLESAASYANDVQRVDSLGGSIDRQPGGSVVLTLTFECLFNRDTI